MVLEIYDLNQYYVKNVGKRRVKRGRNTPRNGKKTWYVALQSYNGGLFLFDVTIFGALVWKLRRIFHPYRPNYDDISEDEY